MTAARGSGHRPGCSGLRGHRGLLGHPGPGFSFHPSFTRPRLCHARLLRPGGSAAAAAASQAAPLTTGRPSSGAGRAVTHHGATRARQTRGAAGPAGSALSGAHAAGAPRPQHSGRPESAGAVGDPRNRRGSSAGRTGARLGPRCRRRAAGTGLPGQAPPRRGSTSSRVPRSKRDVRAVNARPFPAD